MHRWGGIRRGRRSYTLAGRQRQQQRRQDLGGKSGDEALCRRGLVAEVAAHHNGPVNYQLADAADGHLPVVVGAVDDPRAAASGVADGARRISVVSVC